MTIPIAFSASAAVSKQARFAGELGSAELSRLSEALTGAAFRLTVALQAERDGRRQEWLRGTVDGVLPLHCRRCLEVFDWRLALALELRLVGSEDEERRVLEAHEPYRIEEDRLPLRDVVEDEVLLALPMLPMCERCENSAAQRSDSMHDAGLPPGMAAGGVSQPQSLAVPLEQERKFPFADLKKVLSKAP